MFGQQKTFGTGAFGTQSTFGSNVNPFGQTQTNVFGATSAAPAQTNAGTGLFGAPAGQAATGNALFGHPTSTGFGNTNAFGGGFGAQAAQGAAAGTTNLFGAGTGGAVTGGAFGAKPTGFGAPAGTGAFGGTGTGLFGSTAQTAGTTSLFGQPGTAQQGTGLFGQTTAAFSGTTVKFKPLTGTDTMLKNGVTTNINTQHQCITCMKEYELKSLEELRLEDYLAGRKGPVAGSTPFGATTGFGQTSAATGGFGFGAAQQPKPLFGTGTSAFGSSPGMFGQSQQPAGTGLFGQTQQPSAFGQTSTAGTSAFGTSAFGQQSTSLFGQQKPLFGTTPASSSAPAGGGLFGAGAGGAPTFGSAAATSNAPAFGSTAFGAPVSQQPTASIAPFGMGTATTASAAPFSFGAPAASSAGTSLFGANTAAKPAFSFGSSAAGTGTTFGAPTQSTGFSFGAPAAGGSTGLFGAKPATGFGQTTGTGLFGATNAAKPPGFSFFPGNAGGTTGTGAPGGQTGFSFGPTFGSTGTGTGTGLFGTGTGFGTGGLGQPFGQIQPQQSQQQQQQQLDLQKIQQFLMLTSTPYGDHPLFKGTVLDPGKRDEVIKPTNPNAQKAILESSTYKVSSVPLPKPKPRPLDNVSSPTGKKAIFDGLNDNTHSEASFLTSPNVKRLTIRPRLNASSPPPTVAGSNPDRTNAPSIFEPNPLLGCPVPNSPAVSAAPPPPYPPVSSSGSGFGPEQSSPTTTSHHPLSTQMRQETPETNTVSNAPPVQSTPLRSFRLTEPTSPLSSFEITSPGFGGTRTVLGLNSPPQEQSREEPKPQKDAPTHHAAAGMNAGIRLTRVGYYTRPPLDELRRDSNGDCWVDDLVVGRSDYGHVTFLGRTNVADLNLDEIIFFRRKEVTVYPDEMDQSDKPPVGEGLNKRARVQLDCVWPLDKVTHEPIRDPAQLGAMNYAQRLEKATAKLGAKFLEYQPETGSWIFEVKHFSKYGLEDSDEEDDVNEPAGKRPALMTQQQQQLSKRLLLQRQQQQQQQQATVDVSMMGPDGVDDDDSSDIDGSIPALPVLSMDDTDLMMGAPSMASFDDNSPLRREVQDDIFQSPTSHRLAEALGVAPERLQGMKMSMFGDMDLDQEDNMGRGRTLLQAQQRAPSVASSVTTFGSSLPVKMTAATGNDFDGGLTPKSELRRISPRPYVAPPIGERRKEEGNGEREGEMREDKKAVLALKLRHEEEQLLSKFPLMAVEKSKPDPDRELRASLGCQRVQRPLAYIALNESIVAGRHHLYRDVASFHGYRFKPSILPSWTLIRGAGSATTTLDGANGGTSSDALALTERQAPLVTASPLFSIATDDGAGVVAMTMGRRGSRMPFSRLATVFFDRKSVGVSSGLTSGFALSDDTLKRQVSFSDMMLDEDNCPHFKPKRGVDALNAHIAAVNEDGVDNIDREQTGALLELCGALWGSLGEGETPLTNYQEQQRRKQALSQWLVKCTNRVVSEELDHNKSGCARMLTLLSGHRVAEACACAQSASDHRLALVMAQAGYNQRTKQLLQNMILDWQTTKRDAYIELDRLRVYGLLSGILAWTTSDGRLVLACEPFGWDWKRSFASHLWYAIDAASNIGDALASYESAFQAEEQRECAAPYPSYAAQHLSRVDVDNTSRVPFDACYALLRLYCDPSEACDTIVDPTATQPSHLHYADSWLLWTVLSSLGYENSFSFGTVERLHGSFAAQLEAIGMWQWAAFPLLHINDDERRQKSVMALLMRHVTLDRTLAEEERFIHLELHVPVEWIHRAKSVRARALRRYGDEAFFLMQAKMYDAAHRCIVDHIATDAIINGRLVYLGNMLHSLSKQKSSILHWDIQGKIYFHYVNVCQSIQSVIERKIDALQLARLEPQLMALCDCLGALSRTTLRDRLCQAEMSKKTLEVIRALLHYRAESEPEYRYATIAYPVQLIEKLPLPEDYAVQELRPLLEEYKHLQSIRNAGDMMVA